MAATGTKRAREEDDNDTGVAPPSKRTATAEEFPSPTGPVNASNPDAQESQSRASTAAPKSTPHPLAQAPPKRPAEEPAEAPRPRKRPGAAARISTIDKETVIARQKQREEEALKAATTRGIDDAVRQHYNAVPQRGRDWRSTESRIKGLRKFNNWVKSTIIHRFSPPESGEGPALRVLDMGCGKGGDLGKWQSAPHPIDLYIGIDPAEVSIDQARERYSEMMRCGARGGRGGRGGFRGGREHRTFDAEFIAQDAFGQSIGNIPIVRNVGFSEDGGSRWGTGGFDVVTMMFCMHYAFESETKTKGMLHNVAGSLKKGGRFFGVIPNSDFIRTQVVAAHKRKAERIKKKEFDGPDSSGDNLSVAGTGQSDHRPESSNPKKGYSNGVSNNEASGVAERRENTVKDTASEAHQNEPSADQNHIRSREDTTEEDPAVEWGNSIYRVRFPGKTPENGIFRPPFGWKYNYFMEEAVEEVPEYVVPWEAFRAIAEGYNLEQQYRKPFAEVWKEEKDHPFFGPLSERMGVRGQGRGPLLVSDEEMEAASFYHAFCFYKV